MKVVIAGGSGGLDQRIAADLISCGFEVVVLSRSFPTGGWGRHVHWDGVNVGAWAAELTNDAAMINLCGELVDRRPTQANIALLARSRTEPTLALARAAAVLKSSVPVWIQMSTVAIYGEGGDAILDETEPPADGPPQMAGVARAWERSAADVHAGRKLVLRTSIVLDRDTPAFNRLTSLVRWGLGGRIGSGRAWFSWLHIADLLAILRRCLADTDLEGVLHATSANPVRNAELMATLRRAMHRRVGLPAPAPIVRVGALLLRTDPALALTGRRCVPARLLQAGYRFIHADIESAVSAIVLRSGGGVQAEP